MKKIYIKPETELIPINTTEHLLSISGPDVSDTSANQEFGQDVREQSDWDIW